MLLPCPSCKKPVFVSGSALSNGAADVQCSNCGALLKVHPDGSSELQAAPPAETPPVAEEESVRSDAQWREPGAVTTPPLEMPSQPVTEPRVESLSTIAAKRSEQEELTEPPADWPLARAQGNGAVVEDDPFKDTAEIEIPPTPVETLKGTEVIEINSTDAETGAATPPPAPEAAVETPPPVPDTASPVDESGRPHYMKAAAPIYPEKLEQMIPDVVMGTVEITDPRWHEENHEKHRETMKIDRETQKAARAAIAAIGSPPADSSPPVAPPPGAPPPASALPPVAVEPEPVTPSLPEETAKAPAFVAPPVAAPPPVASAEPQMPVAVIDEPLEEPDAPGMGFESSDPVDDDDDFEELAQSRSSPLKALAIAAVLILLVGGALVFFGDDGDVNAGEPIAARTPAPEVEVDEPVSDDAAPAEPDEEPDPNVEPTDSPKPDDTLSPEEKRPKTRATDGRPRRVAAVTPGTRPSTDSPNPRSTEPKVSGSSRDRVRAEQLYVQANRYLQERKYQLAISNLKDCIRLDPRHGGAYRSLGVSYMTLGQERAAIEAYKKFVQILPTHKDAPAVRQIIADYRAR